MTGLVIAGTDTSAERVWDVGVLQDGSMGLLHQYCMAGHDELDRLSAPARWQRTAALLSGVLPGLSEQTVYASHWDWSQQPWVKGGIPNLRPGTGAYLRVLPRAAGRLHFAGDYTTIWAGWMQGAIQSGVRAAQEIDPVIGWQSSAPLSDRANDRTLAVKTTTTAHPKRHDHPGLHTLMGAGSPSGLPLSGSRSSM